VTEALYVVTGASRGMGAALAEQLLRPGLVLLAIARHNPATLKDRAAAQGARLVQWDADLAEPVAVAARLQAWLGTFEASAVASATLINNAALLTRIGPVDTCDDAELAASMRVNLEAPMLLSAAFLRATQAWAAPRRILNISSGLGRRAMAGTASYCAAKAGMDHFTRAAALDEAARPNGARIVSLAPGVIDTDMQVSLRAADPSGFPDRKNFIGLKAGGQLTSSADAAARVLAYLERADFGSEPVADVRGS
jgi:benzil reductase ((S)-benzoin forming)